jgi:small conductance mechanosensitive channel
MVGDILSTLEGAGILSMIEVSEDLIFKLILSAVVLFIASFLSRLVKPLVKRFDDKVDAIEFSKHTLVIVSQVIKYVIYLIALSIILTIFGVTEALYTLLTGGAILGFAIGYASKDILSNMLSGIIVAVDKPFMIGDDIEVGDIRGTVKVLAFRTTKLVTQDGVSVEIPNSEMTSKPIRNYSRK